VGRPIYLFNPPGSGRLGDAAQSRMNAQGELNFDSGGSPEGHTRWLAGRQLAAEQLARRLNLPLGHNVEVWLYGGVRLRGKLQLPEELLFVDEEQVRHMELKVDKVTFAYREMESCVRLA
jgi:hypothetical protein